MFNTAEWVLVGCTAIILLSLLVYISLPSQDVESSDPDRIEITINPLTSYFEVDPGAIPSFQDQFHRSHEPNLPPTKQPFNAHELSTHHMCNWCGKDTGKYNSPWGLRGPGLKYYDFDTLTCLISFAKWLTTRP